MCALLLQNLYILGCGNIYDNVQCENMKEIDRCEKDKSWMSDNCFKTCSKCGTRGNLIIFNNLIENCIYDVYKKTTL